MSIRAITFYAEDRGAWPHFEPIISAITEQLGRSIAYLTSSREDPILDHAAPGVHAYYIGDGLRRSVTFQAMEAGVVVATVPQLGTKLLPKSKRARVLGTEYVYVFHSMVSTHMIYAPDAFDYFDVVFCSGPHMVEEIRRREKLYGLAPKELVHHGYGRLDSLIAARRPEIARGSGPPTVLFAPSWGPQCLFETNGEHFVHAALASGARVIARPHPMTVKHSPGRVALLADRFNGDPNFSLDLDVASETSLHRADLMVSDWSGAALEFAFAFERPVLFVDVPRKVNNPMYGELGITPFEVTVRTDIGEVLEPSHVHSLPAAMHRLLGTRDAHSSKARDVRNKSVFNIGESGEVAAREIVARSDRFLARGSWK